MRESGDGEPSSGVTHRTHIAHCAPLVHEVRTSVYVSVGGGRSNYIAKSPGVYVWVRGSYTCGLAARVLAKC